jgi:hypothetical protein
LLASAEKVSRKLEGRKLQGPCNFEGSKLQDFCKFEGLKLRDFCKFGAPKLQDFRQFARGWVAGGAPRLWLQVCSPVVAKCSSFKLLVVFFV